MCTVFFTSTPPPTHTSIWSIPVTLILHNVYVWYLKINASFFKWIVTLVYSTICLKKYYCLKAICSKTTFINNVNSINSFLPYLGHKVCSILTNTLKEQSTLFFFIIFFKKHIPKHIAIQKKNVLSIFSQCIVWKIYCITMLQLFHHFHLILPTMFYFFTGK